MFLVQSQISDGRVFYAYVTGHEARLLKNWLSVPGSIPNYLAFNNLPTMSFIPPMNCNYANAKWTTSKVQVTKHLANTHVVRQGQADQVLADPQWVRTVLITLQDNPTYTCSGFDMTFKPTLVLDRLRNRATNYRWTNATVVQLMPVQGYPNPPQVTHQVINFNNLPRNNNEDEDKPKPDPKRPCLQDITSRRNVAQ